MNQKKYEKTNFLMKRIKNNPTMSTKEINIITQLKELHGLRRQYFINKFNNELEKNKAINLKLIDDHIRQLENELRNKKGSRTFTYENKFVELLTLLTQLLTKNNSKKLKDDINQILKELYNSKQITKQVYNTLNRT